MGFLSSQQPSRTEWASHLSPNIGLVSASCCPWVSNTDISGRIGDQKCTQKNLNSKSPAKKMWYTTRHEGYDGDTGARKSHQWLSGEMLERYLGSQLRIGFLIRLITAFAVNIGYYAFGGTRVFTWGLEFTTEHMRAETNYIPYLAVWTGIALWSGMHLACFHAFLSDDAAWARGFRAGSKAFGVAIFFDMVGLVLQLVAYVWISANYSELWWENYTTGGVDWLYFAVCKILFGIKFLCMAPAIALLEIYHDEGTSDWHGLMNAFLLCAGGLSYLVAVFFPAESGLGIVLGVITLLSVTFWAFHFEDALIESSTALNETELCNEVEQEVGKFTKLSPYNLQ